MNSESRGTSLCSWRGGSRTPVSDSPQGSGLPLAQEGAQLLRARNAVCVTASLLTHTSTLTRRQEPPQRRDSLVLTRSCQ